MTTPQLDTTLTLRPRSSLCLRYWRVEKRADNRDQPSGAVKDPTAGGDEVRGAWEHRELGLRETGQVPHHAAAEQPEQLDCVLEADGIRIPDDEQGRRRDPPNVLRRPSEGLQVELLQLGDEVGEVVRVRRGPEVFFFDRGPGEGFGRDGRGHLEQLGVHAVTRVGGRGEHELAHYLRVPDGDLKGNAAPHAEAEDIGLLDA